MRTSMLFHAREPCATAISSLVESIRKDSAYGVLLMSLHTARRLLITQIDDAKREGASTVALMGDLVENRMATRRFLAHLKGHASARAGIGS